jgi:acyl-CoA synthetase (NDP forming)
MSPSLIPPGGEAATDSWRESDARLRAHGRLEMALAAARADGRAWLFEPEAMAAVAALGLAVPQHLFLRDAAAAEQAELDGFPGDRLVLKIVAPGVLHKTDVGGVIFLRRDRDALLAAVRTLDDRFAAREPRGYLLCEFVPHDLSPGSELLLGMRWTHDFGPVVTLGLGGVHAELLAGSLAPGRDTAILSSVLHQGSSPVSPPGPAGSSRPVASDAPAPEPSGVARDPVDAVLDGKLFAALVQDGARDQAPGRQRRLLRELLRRALAFADAYVPHDLAEFEINPLVLAPGGPIALDARARLGTGGGRGSEPDPAPLPRPLHKIAHLLHPESIAIVGVSDRRNIGRIILENILSDGFDAERVTVVKPGRESIAGCCCVPDIASLPGRVDLLVVSVDAAQVPDLVDAVVAGRKAESLILIPGGLGEAGSSAPRAARIAAAVRAARASDWQGPVVNGGNCLGIRSVPGRFDTMFIPRAKLRFPTGPPTPLAFLSQSGAFAAARSSQLAWMNPRYLITLGNQTDLTAGDYLTWLQDDPEVRVFACYVEGFRGLDGRRWLEAAARITASGRPVLLYRAGRTPAGAGAAASHTAAIAGDYAVTRELARSAGVLVADTSADFEDLLMLACQLDGKEVRGLRLAALSNAGFECVAMADRAACGFTLADFTPATTAALANVLTARALDTITSVHNPMDVTPIVDDELFECAVRAVLDDPHVDVGVIGCVPLTASLATLPESAGQGEDVAAASSLAQRMARLHRDIRKPWVVVVDSGPAFDPMARLLLEQGVAVFRHADRAVRLFAAFCTWKQAHAPQAEPAPAALPG